MSRWPAVAAIGARRAHMGSAGQTLASVGDGDEWAATPTRTRARSVPKRDREAAREAAGRSGPSGAAARARRLLRHGAVELWPDASHAINGEFPELINDRVTTFLDGAW